MQRTEPLARRPRRRTHTPHRPMYRDLVDRFTLDGELSSALRRLWPAWAILILATGAPLVAPVHTEPIVFALGVACLALLMDAYVTWRERR